MTKITWCFTVLLLAIGITFTPGLASALDVRLRWDANTDPNLAGYLVYYDTDGRGAPYNGTGATEGDSPIDVGNVTNATISGLLDDDNTIYYFTVTAYNNAEPPVESGYSNEVANKYTLELITSGIGDVLLDPPGGVYNKDQTVTMTAVSNAGWRFGEWSGSISSTDNPYTITMESDTTITAIFVEVAIIPVDPPESIRIED